MAAPGHEGAASTSTPAAVPHDDEPKGTSTASSAKQDRDAERNDGADAESNAEPKIEAAAATPSSEPEWAHGIQLFSILVAVVLVCFLMLLDGTIVVAAVPRITDEFNSLEDIGWYGAVYQLGSAVFQPLTGKIYMKFKPKWTFLTFFVVFELGSLICALSNSSGMLIGGRLVAGLGTSGMLNGALILISECVPMQKRPTIIGTVLAIAQLGLASGPLFGGLLTQYSTWRWCFYLNLPIGGAVCALLVLVRVPQQHPRPSPLSVLRTLHTSLDLGGFAIFAPALVMLLLALQWGGTTYAWNSSQVIGLFCGAGATFVVFLYWNFRKGDAAMFPISIARKRVVWTSCIVYALISGNLYTGSYWVPVYFQGVRNATPTMSGVYILPMVIAHVLSGLSSGPRVNRVGFWIPVSIAAAIFLCVGSGLISTFSPDTPTGMWIGFQIILGVGRGLGIQMPILAVQSSTPPQQMPIAMALVMFSQSFGAAVSLSLAETIFSNSFSTLIAQHAPSVNAARVIDAGATGFRNVVSAADLPGVLDAYAQSIDRVFYLCVGMAAGVLIFVWGMGWQDLRKKSKALI